MKIVKPAVFPVEIVDGPHHDLDHFHVCGLIITYLLYERVYFSLQ